MGYEDVRRHLDPVRSFFEAKGQLQISSAYTSDIPKERSIMINTTTNFIGAYLRDESLVVMVRFDDANVDPMIVDYVYDTVRKRIKEILVSTFPMLKPEEIAVNVLDTSGNVGDIEW